MLCHGRPGQQGRGQLLLGAAPCSLGATLLAPQQELPDTSALVMLRSHLLRYAPILTLGDAVVFANQDSVSTHATLSSRLCSPCYVAAVWATLLAMDISTFNHGIHSLHAVSPVELSTRANITRWREAKNPTSSPTPKRYQPHQILVPANTVTSMTQ